MTYLSIIEKLGILFNTMLDFHFILVFSVLLMILTFLYIAKKISIKKYTLLMILSFVIVFGISIISNYEVLSNTFDNFATIFFGNIYFPSIYVYIGVLVIGFIAFIVSILNVMLKKIYKIINSIMFVVNNVLFVIILNIIAKNKIDIFSVNSLYTNTSLVAILELSMGLFIIWALSLIAVYVTNSICERLALKRVNKKETKEKTFDPVLEVSNDLVTDINTLNDLDEVNLAYIGEVSATETSLEVEQIQNVNEGNVMAMQNDVAKDVVNENVVFEEIVPSDEEFIIEEVSENVENHEISNINNEVVIEESTIAEVASENRNNITFNDILNGSIPVTYYDNSFVNTEYNLVDPQIVYEDNYNKVKSESVIFNSIEVTLEDTEEVVKFNNIDMILNDNTEKDNIILNNTSVQEEVQLSVEELTKIEKERVSEERLSINTISLNDLIDEEEVISNVEVMKDTTDVLEVNETNDNTYSLDDYKKIVKMLTEIKNHSNGTSINIDDAVAISLINNYSIDDCLKFKNILESNLN